MSFFVGKCDVCKALSRMLERTNAARLSLPAGGQPIRFLVCDQCQRRLLARVEQARKEAS